MKKLHLLKIIILALIFLLNLDRNLFASNLNDLKIFQLGSSEFLFKLYGRNLPEPEIFYQDNKLRINLKNCVCHEKNLNNINLQGIIYSKTAPAISKFNAELIDKDFIQINIETQNNISLTSGQITNGGYNLRIKLNDLNFTEQINFNVAESENKINLPQNILPFNDDTKITLKFFGISLNDALRLIGDRTGYNILIDPSLPSSNDVTISLNNIRADDAFNYLMTAYGVSCYAIDENTLIFGTREGLLKFSGYDETKIFNISWADPAHIKSIVKTLAGIQDENIIIDSRLKKIYVKANPAKLNEISKLIQDIDKPGKQVMIRASIFEFNSSATSDIEAGLNAAYDHIRFNFNSGSGFISYVGEKAARQIEQTFTLLESRGKGNVIANPSVIALDGAQAEISLTEDYPYISQRDDEGDVTWNTMTIGPQLIFTPRIGNNNFINLKINIKTGEIIGLSTGSNGEIMPRASSRSVETELYVHDGMPFVIGGLYHETKSKQKIKFPILGDLPLIGGLFKYKYDDNNKTQVVIVITPYILDSP